MRVAFDVKGTINGPKQDLVLKLLKGFQAQGHECVVWSSLYSYATEAVEKHSLNCEAMTKYTTFDARNQSLPAFDLAIDDEHMGSVFLASEKFLFVDELTEESVNKVLEGSYVYQQKAE